MNGSTRIETRLLQAALAIACFVPILGGAAGLWFGANVTGDLDLPRATNLDSHFRYLSGLLLGLGLAVLTCVPGIAAKGRLFQTLGAMVVIGGLGRLLSLLALGLPATEHRFALAMELGVVPALMLWQWRVSRLTLRKARQPRGRETLRPATPLYMASDRQRSPGRPGKPRLSSPERT